VGEAVRESNHSGYTFIVTVSSCDKDGDGLKPSRKQSSYMAKPQVNPAPR